MRTQRSSRVYRSQAGRGLREQRSLIEPLEQRQLLSVTPILVGRPNVGGGTGIHVPVAVDTGTVSGTVDSTGTGVANAIVVLTPAPTTTGGGTTTPLRHRLLIARTAADGSFTLKNVPVGSYTATAYKSGFTPDTSASFAVTKGNTTTVPLTLTAIQYGSVSGSVIDSSKKPVDDAIVVLTPASSTTPGSTTAPKPGPVFPFGPRLITTTDSSGDYSLPKVPAGTYNVTVYKQGDQPGTATGIVVTQGANTAIPPITLTAIPAPTFGTVTGQVTDTSGKGIASALVEIAPTPTPVTGGGTTTTTTVFPWPGPIRFTRTDANGNYTFDEIRTGNYTVTAIAQGYQSNSENVTVVQGANAVPAIQLTALPAPTFGSVTGSVTDAATGKPIAGAIVELVRPIPPGSEMPSPTIAQPLPFVTTTDANGDFSFDKVPTGAYTLNVFKNGYERSSTSVTINTGANALPAVQLTALPAPVFATVTGEVDAGGKPLADALVVLTPAGKPIVGGPTAANIAFPPGGPVQIARTDSAGIYTFDKVPAGTYVITAYAPGYQPTSTGDLVVSSGTITAPTITLMAATAPPPVMPMPI